RLQIAAESLDAELRSGATRDVQPQRTRVGFEAVSARWLDRSRVHDVTAHGLRAHVLRLNSHEPDITAHRARLDVSSHVLRAKFAADSFRSQISIHLRSVDRP